MASFGVPFSSSRTYSSRNPDTGVFGPGWAWSYGMRVVESAEGALVRAEDGAEAQFALVDGAYRRPAGVRSTLRRDGDGWLLVTADQISYRFDAQGRLASVANARGAGVRLAYAADSVRITDASGRTAVATLDGGLVREIKLPDHRSVRYFYADGRLVGYRDARGFVWSYRYGLSGQLTELKTPQRVVLLRNEYDASGRVGRQLDARGKATEFRWDAGAQEATTTDPDGVVVRDGYRSNVLVYTQRGNQESDNHRYDASLNRNLVVNGKQLQHESTHDAAGNPTSQTAPRPMSISTVTRYDARNNPVEYTDANGNVWKDTYNDFNELIRSEDAEHHTIGYAYDDRGLLVAMTDQRGKVTRYENLPAGDQNAGLLSAVTTPTGARMEYCYDRTGRQVGMIDPRGTVPGADRRDYTTWTTYDAQDREIEVQQPGKRGSWRTAYDEVGQTSRTVTPTGVTTKYAYDPAGRLTSTSNARQQMAYTYTAAGRKASQRVVLPHEADQVTTYTYNGKGLLFQVTSPRGNLKGANKAEFTTTYHYDGNDNLVRTSRPYPGGQIVSRDVNVDELDRTASTVDEFGKTASNSRDNTGNVTATTDTLGRQAGMEYDRNGRQTATRDTGGNVTRTEYDPAGNKIKETSPTGGVTTWAYDDDGMLISSTEARGNVEGADPERFTTHYVFDPAGNRVQTIDPLDHVTRYRYDVNNRLVAATDANGHTVRYTYREDDLPATIHAPDARFDPRDPESKATVYDYDEIGQLVKVTDPNGNSSRARFDAAGRVVESTDPLGRRTRYGYDVENNRISTITLADGERVGDTERARRTIVDSFDIVGRRDKRQVGSNGPVYAWGYDAKDRITSYGDPTGVRTVSYDDEDQIQRVVRTEASGEVERFSYDYDARGNIISRSYPDGTKITAGYDAGSRITELTASGGSTGPTPATWRFGYDVADRRTSTTLPAPTGLVEQRGYDDAGRLTSIGTTRPDGSPPSGVQDPVSAFQLELDPVGNPTRAVTTRGGVSESVAYAYDPADRLTSACYGATTCTKKSAAAGRIDYTYDLVGNRTSQTRTGSAGNDTTRYDYDDADQLTRQTVRSGYQATVTDYRYDLNGNQTRAGKDRLEYNLDNTLAKATIDGRTTAFGYDATGLRLTATTGSGTQVATQRWTWDTNGTLPQLATESTVNAAGATSAVQSYVYGPDDEPLALLQPSTGPHAYTHDWLGGVADMLTPTGVPEAAYDYDPFGNPRTGPTLGDQASAEAPANPMQLTGAYQDSSTGKGNYYLRARNYNPTTGRFASVDPAEQTGSAVSAYAYADNNPTSYTDPTGMEPAPAETGPSPEDMAKAQQLQSKSVLDIILEAGGQILMEFLGINDLMSCLKGNLGSCVMLVVGSLPWGKIFKAKKIAEAIYRAGRAVISFLKELDWARAIIRGAERAAEAAKAAAALAAKQAAEKAAAAKAAAEAAAKKAAERAAARARAAAAKAKAATKKASKKAEDTAKDVKKCRDSFVAGTPVLLATGGSKPIEQVQPGDAVAAPATGDTGRAGTATIRTGATGSTST
jgi:RHS repeat-associated protein